MLGHTGLYQKWKTREKRLENGEYRELLLKSEEKQRMAKYLATSRLGSLINLIPKRKCGERSWSLIAVTYFKKTIKMYWILKVSHLQGQLVFSGYGFHGGQKIKVKEYKSTWKRRQPTTKIRSMSHAISENRSRVTIVEDIHSYLCAKPPTLLIWVQKLNKEILHRSP